MTIIEKTHKLENTIKTLLENTDKGGSLYDTAQCLEHSLKKPGILMDAKRYQNLVELIKKAKNEGRNRQDKAIKTVFRQ